MDFCLRASTRFCKSSFAFCSCSGTLLSTASLLHTKTVKIVGWFSFWYFHQSDYDCHQQQSKKIPYYISFMTYDSKLTACVYNTSSVSKVLQRHKTCMRRKKKQTSAPRNYVIIFNFLLFLVMFTIMSNKKTWKCLHGNSRSFTQEKTFGGLLDKTRLRLQVQNYSQRYSP